MKNRFILWIALGSLFLNIGVASAVAYVYWQGQMGPEPWRVLEETSDWNDEDWAQLDSLLEDRHVRIEGLGALIDEQADEMLQALWQEDLDPGAVLENFNRVEFLDTLPFEKREALLDFLLEEDEFALWFM